MLPRFHKQLTNTDTSLRLIIVILIIIVVVVLVIIMGRRRGCLEDLVGLVVGKAFFGFLLVVGQLLIDSLFVLLGRCGLGQVTLHVRCHVQWILVDQHAAEAFLENAMQVQHESSWNE